MSTNKCLSLTAIFLLCLLSLPTKALLVNNYELPDKIFVEDAEMLLQGAAIRNFYLMVQGYIGALYLEEPSSDPETIFASQGYQRMSFLMLRPKMSSRRIANVFYESIQLNTPAEELLSYKKELDQIFSVVEGSLRRGDKAIFEYMPEEGVRIEIAGVDKGVFPADKKLFNLFLRVWIGKTPPNERFKEKLLGLAPAG